MKKAPFFEIGSIFSNSPSFYNIDGPAYWVQFDKDISTDTYLRNLNKTCRYFIYVVGCGSLP